MLECQYFVTLFFFFVILACDTLINKAFTTLFFQIHLFFNKAEAFNNLNNNAMI